ncbi:MAG: hypothetical protein KGL39_03090 [Patescibacteria group bacterium]|nr:hypothetical protein [Patescibacteria group bacterium]
MDTVKFELGSFVYRKTAPEVMGIVTGILVRQDGIIYYVKWGQAAEYCMHFEMELTAEKDYKSACE